MGNLKEILNHYEVTPSAGSWERLSQRLDIVMTAGKAAGTTLETASSMAGKNALISGTGKIITAVVSTLVAATALTTIIIRSNKDELPTAQPTQNTIIPHDTVTNDSSCEKTLFHPTPHTVESDTIHSSDIQTENTEPSNTITVTQTSLHTHSQPEANQIESKDLKAISTIVSTQPITPSPKVSQPKVTTITSPVHSTLAKNVQSDPVVQQHAEELDWGQPDKIEIPNVFTPNGDGYNDRFVIKGIEQCGKRQLIVRNRSGKIVFQSNYYENTWDGENCADGIYAYQFICNTGTIDQTMTGTVTILRK